MYTFPTEKLTAFEKKSDWLHTTILCVLNVSLSQVIVRSLWSPLASILYRLSNTLIVYIHLDIEKGRSYRLMAARSSSFEEDDMIKAASTRFVVCSMCLIIALYLGTVSTIAFKVIYVGFSVLRIYLRCSHSGDNFVIWYLGIGVSNQLDDQEVTLQGGMVFIAWSPGRLESQDAITWVDFR